jgi:DNA-binding MarR family transcriptional regulator
MSGHQVDLTLVLATRAVLGVYRRLLEPLGLTHPQYLVLTSLWQQGPLTVKALGRLLQLDSGTLSPLLKRLETMGLVTRRRAEEDERTVVVAVTDAGLALRTAASGVANAALDRFGISSEDARQLREVLGRLVQAAHPA